VKDNNSKILNTNQREYFDTVDHIEINCLFK
jgi:hypothetical protein